MLKVLQPQIITLWISTAIRPTTTPAPEPWCPIAPAPHERGTATNSLNSNVAPVSFDPNLTDNSKWRSAIFRARHRQQDSGAEFRVSTVGCRNIASLGPL